MSDKGVYEQLTERFAPEDHKTKTIGGTTLTYIDGEMVTSRLNEVLGLGGWSFEVKDIKVLDNEVWALGRMTVYGPDRTVVREQAGGQIINRKKSGEIIELSNDIKGAVTDCMKKCATLLGVGLYLYDKAERMEVEQEMREAKRNPQQRPAQPPKNVQDAAELTGAEPTPISSERAENIKKVQAVMRMALAEGLEFTQHDPFTMTDESLQTFGKTLSDRVRSARAAKKAG